MIDAYEIGIQLLLQEDVSAGLAVINRGLAEVDRAIAVTSADLTGLVQDAERAAKAVVVAVGGRAPQVGAAATKASVATPEDAPSRPMREGVPVADAAAPVSVGGRDVGQPTAAPRQGAPLEASQATSAPQTPVLAERISPVSAPTQSGGNEIGGPDRRASEPLASPVGAPSVAPTESVPSISDALQRQGRHDPVAAESGRQRGPVAPNTTIAVTAAIGQLRPAPSPVAQRERFGAQAGTTSSTGRERVAAASWSSADHATPQSLSARPAERAAAPQSPGRDRADGGGGGTVMLDGRLVGQWLSEHMAREASRPPGGTSFFDARQTPAWNVSGAL